MLTMAKRLHNQCQKIEIKLWKDFFFVMLADWQVKITLPIFAGDPPMIRVLWTPENPHPSWGVNKRPLTSVTAIEGCIEDVCELPNLKKPSQQNPSFKLHFSFKYTYHRSLISYNACVFYWYTEMSSSIGMNDLTFRNEFDNEFIWWYKYK